LSRPLVTDKKISTSANKMRNSQRATQGRDSRDSVIISLGCAFPISENRLAIQCGTVQDHTQTLGLEFLGGVAIIAEGNVLAGVVSRLFRTFD
jgi:hypothetical protein